MSLYLESDAVCYRDLFLRGYETAECEVILSRGKWGKARRHSFKQQVEACVKQIDRYGHVTFRDSDAQEATALVSISSRFRRPDVLKDMLYEALLKSLRPVYDSQVSVRLVNDF